MSGPQSSRGHSSVFKVRASPVREDLANLGSPQPWKSQLSQDLAAWLKASYLLFKKAVTADTLTHGPEPAGAPLR